MVLALRTVGVRWPRANKLQLGEMNENETHGTTSEVATTLCAQPKRGAHVGLFIVGGQGSYYMVIMPLTTYPANKAHGQGVI
jgi:hypothetical protein